MWVTPAAAGCGPSPATWHLALGCMGQGNGVPGLVPWERPLKSPSLRTGTRRPVSRGRARAQTAERRNSVGIQEREGAVDAAIHTARERGEGKGARTPRGSPPPPGGANGFQEAKEGGGKSTFYVQSTETHTLFKQIYSMHVVLKFYGWGLQGLFHGRKWVIMK